MAGCRVTSADKGLKTLCKINKKGKNNGLKSNKTIIIISHKPDNLKICDKIYKVENKNLIKI